jgi:hypothetical protein
MGYFRKEIGFVNGKRPIKIFVFSADRSQTLSVDD